MATPTVDEGDDPVAAARRVHRRTGPTFYLATRLFPARVRRETYVLYGFFRLADEVVDDPDRTDPAAQRRELDRIERAALGREPTDDPILAAFADLRERYDLPAREVETFVDAMRMDVERDRYESHDDLAAYLRGSSVAVANVMLAVMGPDDPDAARPHAAALAEAFQLTNFLRDVREDVQDYGRVYLPQDRLAAAGTSDAQIRSLTCTEAVADAISAELERTEKRYAEGVEGIQHLPRDCQFPVLLAAVCYADHHRAIRDRDYDVLSSRPTLSRSRRLALLARTWWHWHRTADPVATFVRASSIPTVETLSTPEPARSRCSIRRFFRA
ncbi:phytoene/squalene synthase family protein [Halovivax gelatinilyticus]|uniref:phytoene/squalene synthase family protein n=1 Tax=Halovivax gelatinilyticus TaxID=2961597 RepID=UPI0020CA8644|nr:phytoene/squalene synthase family protein [Halovivax gelatinilyticus]